MSKRFINKPSTVVSDLMQGLSLDASRATLVDPSTGHAITINSDLLSSTHRPLVSVVSGGGSGHEPMAAGYVGHGMLSAAVSGGVFSSPSVPAITTMLDVVAPLSSGILVIVMNYQGDRLNFKKAVADLEARNPNYPIEIVVVADDVSIDGAPEPRGIAGTIFVMKVAGAAAAEGKKLQEVKTIAEKAGASIASFGVALDPCTIPGHEVDKHRLNDELIELGMGIHNEPGIEQRRISKGDQDNFASSLISEICQRVDDALAKRPALVEHAHTIAVMVNNLGAVSQAEMLILNKSVADFIYSGKGKVLRGTKPVHMFSGLFMTSLQMNGVSITAFLIANDDGDMEHLLHTTTNVLSWNTGFRLTPPANRVVVVPPGIDIRTVPQGIAPTVQEDQVLASTYIPAGMRSTATETVLENVTRDGSGLSERTERYIMMIIAAVTRNAEELNRMDRRTGDGDMGDTARRGCEQISEDLRKGKYAHAANNPSLLFMLLSQSCSQMGGTLGSITMSFLEGMSASFGNKSSWREAVVEGTETVMRHGGAGIGDRTLIDSLKPASEVLIEGGSLAEAAQAAKEGYESTMRMSSAKYGRSQHLNAKQLLNHADPGAYAIWIALEALKDAHADS